MKNRMIGRGFALLTLCLVAGCRLINGMEPTIQVTDPVQPEDDINATVTFPPADEAVETEADRDGVFVIRSDGQRQALPSPDQTFLQVGEGVDVDQQGRAILRFSDLLNVEVLRDGELVVKDLSIDQQSAFITVLQTGGTLLNDFNPGEEIERRLTVETEFATITATGTRFLVLREAGSPLEWVVGLDAGEGDLEVTADGVTKSVISSQARWIAPVGEPSPGISPEMGTVSDWLDRVQDGAQVNEFGEIAWPPADIVVAARELSTLPAPGAPFTLGGVTLTLDPQGSYALEDCSGDGFHDLSMRNGNLGMDFRSVLSRVRALDVTVVNRADLEGGTLRVLDPGRNEITSQALAYEGGGAQVVSLRSDQPYHYAELNLRDGCLLGFSLTPPTADGQPGPPRAVGSGGPFLRIDQPVDGSQDTVNGFLVSGVATMDRLEQIVSVSVETLDGKLIQRTGLGLIGDPASGVGTFEGKIVVNFPLPADVRLVASLVEPEAGGPGAEDSLSLTPLLPGDVGLERPLENGVLRALPVGPDGFLPEIAIDGTLDDWLALQGRSGVSWTPIDRLVFDQGCAARHPKAPQAPPADLAGQVYFGYDEFFLYVAFLVEDEGFVGYSGEELKYYRGDAPQLLLDLDLPRDFTDSTPNGDDLQVDLLPGIRVPGDAPSVASRPLFILGQPRLLPDAKIQSAVTESGYFVEAAIPWRGGLVYTLRAGNRAGVAASLSDNDTPGTVVQECMLSTTPNRDFADPTTWGTLIFEFGP